MRILFLILFSAIFFLEATAQTKFQIVEVTDSTYRVDQINENGDGIEYTIPGIELDSTSLVNAAFQEVERNFEMQGYRQTQANVHNVDARRLMQEVNRALNANYYANNTIAEQFQGDWVLVAEDRKKIELKNRRFLDGEQFYVARFKSRSSFETVGMFEDELVLEWYKVNRDDRIIFIAEYKGNLIRLVKV